MTLGFMTSFYNVRYLFRKDFLKRYGDNKMILQLEAYSQKYKGLAVMFFRIFFIIPYNMQNVAHGLSKINTLHYLWGSMAGILPTTIFYVWLGHALGNKIITLSDFRNMSGIFAVIFIIFGALLLVSFIIKRNFKDTSKKE
jgi:uncharacterized membrane protein YdjX (TVP38/TMEM64 family)